ncbi:hypothetical protein [Lagierella sp.]|uniref:hypothetical protein n=1 Tax=Lagierella sp. TaxID=2849657 RepID=UPI0026052DC5|nr:hypothetical protein [Lagierella sp.]
MILLENKYELFKRVTYDKKKAELEEHYNKLQNKLEEEFQNYKSQREKEFDLQILKEKRNVSTEINEKLQVEENRSKEEILKFRERMIEDIHKDVLNQYKSYIEQEDYVSSLKDQLKDYYDKEDYIIGMTKRDANRLGFDEDKVNLLPEDIIGGYTLENVKDSSIIDNTIREFVKNNRKTIGLVIQNFINKVGGKVDGE